jgi:hypothetical protein
MEMSDQLHAPAIYIRKKSILYPFYKRLGRPQSRSGCGGEEKTYIILRESIPGSPASSSVTILTDLPQLPPIISKYGKYMSMYWTFTELFQRIVKSCQHKKITQSNLT